MFGSAAVFISYRRSDAEEAARSLYEALKARFRGRPVFFDTAAIPWGEDFRRVVEERIRQSTVVLVVMGPEWALARNEHGLRLAQPDDPVAFELRTALQAGRRIIPVRVRGAPPPAEADLPPEFRELPYRNAPRVQGDSFDRDVNELYRQIVGELDDLTLAERLRAVSIGTPVATAAIAVVLLAATWTGAFSLVGIDAHLRRLLLAASGSDSADAVRLVTIDAASERALGREFGPLEAVPAWRADHARLVEKVAASGARVLAFDIFFEAPRGASDDGLAQAVRRAAERVPPMRVVFGVRQLVQERPRLVPVLADAGTWGTVCPSRSAGGALWWVPLAVAAGPPDRGSATRPADRPALALAAVAPGRLLEADLDRRELRFDAPTRGTPIRYSDVERQRAETRGCATARPGEDKLNLLVRIAAPGHWQAAGRSLSYAELLGAPDADPRLRDRIVLVGATALSGAGPDADIQTVVTGLTARNVFGVEIHADAITTLLGGKVPQLPTADEQLWTTLAASLGGASSAFWLYRRPLPVQRLALLALFGGIVATAWVLARGGFLLDLVNAAVSLWLGYFCARALQGLAARGPRSRKDAS